MKHLSLTIGGEAVATEARLEVIDPALGRPFAHCPDARGAELARAIDAAREAFPAWRAEEAARRGHLSACAEAIAARAGELAELLTREQGKPLAQARGEVAGTQLWFAKAAKQALPVEVVADDDKVRIEVHHRPLGVVAAVTPWNFPLVLAAWKLAPALLAGNTVVLKPSPYTPLTSLLLGEILRPVLPPGVLNVVSGGDSLGAQLVSHPAVRKVSFTGSVATGKAIARAAADDLKRLTLELGGNDAALVLDDVDPRAIAKPLFWAAFANSGQVCVAVKRLYVADAVYQPLLEALTELARGATLGSGLDPATRLGPVQNARQLERVAGLVERARQDGGRVLAGGARAAGEGYFYPATVVTDLPDATPLVAEEQFGPVLPVLRFERLDDALARANATMYGLAGSIWTADAARGAALARELECGTVWVNQHNVFHPFAPFGGHKWSGIGYENGRWGLEGFTQLQAVHVPK